MYATQGKANNKKGEKLATVRELRRAALSRQRRCFVLYLPRALRWGGAGWSCPLLLHYTM